MKEKHSLSLTAQPPVLRCKLVVVGDVQCGKTAMLQVLAKDSYPESYVATVFENYTASVQLEDHRVELSLWDTSGSPYYDNVRPLCYSDSDAILVCFDISRPETLDSAVKKWKTEIRDYCPRCSVLLVGCKADLRTDYSTVWELSSQHQTPVSQEQGALCAEQMGAEGYLECSAFTSERSVHSAIRASCQTFISRLGPPRERPGAGAGGGHPPRRFPLRILPSAGRSGLSPLPRTLPQDKAKSCCLM